MLPSVRMFPAQVSTRWLACGGQWASLEICESTCYEVIYLQLTSQYHWNDIQHVKHLNAVFINVDISPISK
jgi:hypothetical protein